MVVHLTEPQKQKLLSMNNYWEEISKREEWRQKMNADGELVQLLSVLTPMQVLLIVGEYAKNN